MAKLSLVVPVYNEQDTVALFYDAIEKERKNFSNYELEYWYVDDGSSDKTLERVEQLAQKDNNIHYVSFSRNFGKESALYAGLEHATGDFVAVMDVDLQDPPELLNEMLEGVSSGEWDAVGARRTTRDGEPLIRSWFSKLFYKLINSMSDTHIVEGARDFRVMSRQMVDAILSMKEYNRFSKGIFSWVGFKQKYLEYENKDRVAGNTSWSFFGLLKYSIEGFIDFSRAPLLIVSVLGSLAFVMAIIGAVLVFVRALIHPNVSAFGWPSLVVIMLALGGIQLLSLGIVGRYISNIYLESKRRPIYIARKVK
ncbi:glycosyltransferase family 2 protein [Weissella paramesenteroides]|jgi:glucosyltransferase|uniref:glycosyltransferase family 2 protein n=1 Tax=Weissella paramesenteroides TaxID=1249 RepID=UPI00103ED628|nr:glycosyltransferase family 2 protein [Weissella paramesenteroides]RZQ58368.1 glycosyltransferase [Weissella paramesenteroides]